MTPDRLAQIYQRFSGGKDVVVQCEFSVGSRVDVATRVLADQHL